FVARPRTGDTIEADELAAGLEDLVVVDARLPARWRGEPNPIDKVPGRIPGAVNAPWNEELPDLPAGELVAYCGSGVTATVVLHRLALAGREGRLYPGSWSEWEQRSELPVEQS
ncbi:MAG: thiosulfate/3-mercaptopyruvate sulfurtransferase, partial [Gaiellaceae bacterium]|nr:thiosulfate/3-mercaptopyruvate sulfurtransferase [Gaiellaceae bacterium]